MKKMLQLAMVALMVLAMLTGCTSLKDTQESIAAEESKESEYFYATIGEKMSCVFFDFTVDEVWYSDEYEIDEGDKLLDVTVTITNTFGEDLPMFNGDFFLSYGDGDDEYCFGSLPAGDTNPLNMPESYTLADGDTVTYHVYYEVPESATEFYFVYVEYYENGNLGDYYCVYFTE